ncbi:MULTISPECIES: type II toxin-antitoxin system VapC family toxin [unclassified Roseofilum]|uniref:type II toxin-antitoxin system VapC family toxin n=1 Tax=unclassified Roseofilum TaxID=2620099 RepID=UPI000E959EA5|nr:MULTISPECIES: PIN domain-containing protein [unclassified Roseofilum]HBQ98234.1 PIN domain nuclease [Cyanobacteria bacterium UBA11691]MBP0009554.1 type II toxin-antitoxin system VapC family toxin [Roseofilum sp. Belize Diploria]MBP0013723.1 type II toxin-antitoxin system VapC family toxin [Roseofilum sp. SID3]MBP0024936.1 type II toxin-antitoxin system VapC family toxin [Roseofilum sp. SID2]MBP0032714.1 type II toxin-antitoxin system VapC family toxin [Roseofilum sp. Belize BBD 4]
MKILLDTHIWIWYLLGDQRLPIHMQTVIADPKTQLWLSPISIWETLVLSEKGRISLQPDANTWVDFALQSLPTHEAKLNYAIAILSRKIAVRHQDPADRFIAATALQYGLTLATVDAHLTGHSWLPTL